MSNLKNYEKQKYSGNENGWHEPIVNIGVTAITEAVAAELNSHFRNTGVKYEETDKEPSGEATRDEADHGERGLVVKDGEFVPTDNKPADTLEEAAKELKESDKDEKPLKDAAPEDLKADGETFVKSDNTIQETTLDTDKDGHIEGSNKVPNQDTTAGE